MTESSILALSATHVQQRFRALGFRYCFIGGIAVQRWGEPRVTRDLDLTLMTGFGPEAQFADAILAEWQPRIREAREFALLNRVLLVRDELGTPIDIAFGAMPFERRTIDRATIYELEPGCPITTCSASDLIVHKAFAGRERDWSDIRGIIVRSPQAIDWQLVFAEFTPLAELSENPHSLTRLAELRDSLT